MGTRSKFVAVSNDYEKMKEFVKYINELFDRKYVGENYKWRIMGTHREDLSQHNDFYIYEGELWSCGQSELEHWVVLDGKTDEFSGIKFFIDVAYQDYVNGSGVVADIHYNVFNLITGELCDECLPFISDMPIVEIADRFGITMDE